MKGRNKVKLNSFLLENIKKQFKSRKRKTFTVRKEKKKNIHSKKGEIETDINFFFELVLSSTNKVISLYQSKTRCQTFL